MSGASWMKKENTGQKSIVLVITRDASIGRLAMAALEDEHRHIVLARGPQPGMNLLRRDRIGSMIVDAMVSNSDLAQLAVEARRTGRDISLIALVDPMARGRQEISAKMGIDEILEKPIQPHQLREAIGRIEHRRQIRVESGLLGRSERMHEVMELILQAARTSLPILITGESGTGKDLAAQAIHRYSARRDKPFLPVHCAAIPETLLESELFGHERGAFTDAKTAREGLFEAANKGTIFLDEVGEMALMTQIKLLRALEEQEFIRVGGSQPIRVDIRVISATNKSLRNAVREGAFREDLYYRLRVIEIEMPPLRERREDVPILANAFIQRYCAQNDVSFPGISEEAMEQLKEYGWPGNVRELRNVIESMIARTPESEILPEDLDQYLEEPIVLNRNLPVPLHKTPDQSERELILRALWELGVNLERARKDIADLKSYVMDQERGVRETPVYSPEYVPFTENADEIGPDFEEAPPEIRPMEEVEEEMIRRALRSTGGNRKQAAKALGIAERTFYRKLNKLGLTSSHA